MTGRARLLLRPGLYVYLARRCLEFLRQLVRDYVHHRPLPAHRLLVGAGAQIGKRVVLGIESGVGDDDPACFEIGEHAYIEDGAELGLIPGSRLVIGRNTSVHRGCVILGNVRIGANCVFSYNIYAATGMHVIRERPNWLIKDQDEAFATARLSETVWIDDDAWIGWGVYVRSGVHIGRGAVIGANAAVMSDVEPYAIYAGVPARKIGERLTFSPPAEIDAMNDASLPYFYSGFLDDRASLAESRARGGIRLAGASRIVLAAATEGAVRVCGIVAAGGREVDLRISVNGRQVAGERLSAGPYELVVRQQPADSGILPPLLQAHTVLELDPGADAPRVSIRSAALSGTG